MYKRTFKEDYKTGTEAEKRILNDINEYFKDDIKQIKDKYNKYDYEGITSIYELKTRTNKYNTFNTTLLGFDKIINNDKKQIFIFNFIDGLYYIEYNKIIFDEFEKKLFVRNKRNDYNDKEKIYLFIPINKLIKI